MSYESHKCEVPGCGQPANSYSRSKMENRRIWCCAQCVEGLPVWAIYHYLACRIEGTPHSLAEMFALREPPMSNTDREYLEGRCNGNQFEKTPAIGDYYRKVANRAGVNTTGMIYNGGLAEYPGDPQAWVSGRGDIQRRCEEKGWGCEGTVNMPVRNVQPVEEVAVADDILESHVQDVLDDRPDLTPKKDELKHEIKEKIKPHWAK